MEEKIKKGNYLYDGVMVFLYPDPIDDSKSILIPHLSHEDIGNGSGNAITKNNSELHLMFSKEKFSDTP